MALKIYNTLTRTKEEFVPLHKGFVGMYVCGPTVYDHAHIGHAKSYISFDVMVRYLRYLGYRVRYVQNITDVGHLLDSGEDRILKKAAHDRIEPMEVVEKYTKSYFDDMDALFLQRPDISPRASGHVPEQIELVKRLLEKGYAYEVNGSVYFDITKYPEYGSLSHRKVEDQEAGARVEVSDEKRHPADFALWKKAEPEHIMRWNSPWGWGFPGWHVECSTMAMKYLGDTIDIHGGGMENIFPHHECEIAQSVAATDKPFVRYWLHNNMVLINGTKMSKSLGNHITVKDALKKYSAEQIRFFILTTHYRSTVDFSDKALNSAGQGLSRLLGVMQSLKRKAASVPEGTAQDEFVGKIDSRKKEFLTAMDDDFNTAAAIGVLFEAVRDVNTFLESTSAITKGDIEYANIFFNDLSNTILGVPLDVEKEDSAKTDEIVRILIDLRANARQDGNYDQADMIRNRLNEAGIVLKDSKEGTIWSLM